MGMDKKKEAFAEVHDADETPVHAEMSTFIDLRPAERVSESLSSLKPGPPKPLN